MSPARQRKPYKHTGSFHRRLLKEKKRLQLLVASSEMRKLRQSTNNNAISVPDVSESCVCSTAMFELMPNDHITTDEDSEGNDEEFLNNQYSAVDDLKSWMLKNKITHTAATKLLKYLGKYNVLGLSLPADSRSFLSTPRKVNIQRMGEGQFYYRGLRTCLLEQFSDIQKSITLRLVFNIDGLPLYGGSKKEFWPILCAVDKMPGKSVMVVAIYLGESKPNIQLFFEEFVSELSEILKTGVEINSQVKLTIISAYFICDCPARCHVKG